MESDVNGWSLPSIPRLTAWDEVGGHLLVPGTRKRGETGKHVPSEGRVRLSLRGLECPPLSGQQSPTQDSKVMACPCPRRAVIHTL